MPKNTPIRIIDSQKTRAVSFLGGSASAGGTTDHGLLLGLNDDDHAQYLRTDGTRTLTGNMLVSASVTIDGVDLSAHAADANAHHAQQHVITGSDHTVTGSQYQIVGLTSTNTLGLLTAASSPTTNQVVKTDGSSGVTLVDLTVSSDLFMTGTLDFGTDTITEDATYLQVAGSKAVRFAQNIGNAAWTINSTGAATFGGSVDILGSGDLYVAGSLGGAGGVLKTSGNRVGIACVPDSQFALDVAGPCRAQYFIGPHALQLKDATMICHYDGAAPYKNNYNGIALGHMGQIGTHGTGVIYRPGKFGKAIQLSENTTNLITNPSFETNLTGWSTATGTTVARSAVKSWYGDYSALLNASAGTTIFQTTASVTSGTTYTLSAWVLLTSSSGTLNMDLNDRSYEVEQTLTTKNVWTRMVMTFTPNASHTVTIRFYSTTNVVAYIDAVQLEVLPYCTPYCDGSLGNGHAWTGTAHASTSTRPSAALNYPSKVVDAAEGTVSTWVSLDGFYYAGRLFHFCDTDGDFDYYIVSNGDATFRYNGTSLAGGTLSVRTWHHVAVTWSRAAGQITTYLDGTQVAQTAISATATIDATSIYIGSKWSAQPLNGLVDDFTILSVAASANEVRAIYESNAPVFAESSTVSWVATPSGLVWADERGLWMRDTAGNSVLGVYGGEAATYSWGGFTMASGDLVLGRNAVGSSAIMWDQSAGTFGFYGAGSATAQVVIATDGKLTAGAGKVSLDSTGFTAYNASNVATVYITENGMSTGDGGARTTIGTWTSGSRIKWYTVGELYAATPEDYLDDSSVTRTLYPLVVRAIRQSNDAALIELAAVKSSDGAGAKIIIGEGFRLKGYFAGSGTSYSTNRVVHAIADDVVLEANNLQWVGMTTSTSAVGTYAGKIKIRINGTDRYIPYYAS